MKQILPNGKESFYELRFHSIGGQGAYTTGQMVASTASTIEGLKSFTSPVFKDDIGVSGVVGSAVFNITLVIAVCALAAPRPFTLNWYSVCRYSLTLHYACYRGLCPCSYPALHS